MVTRYNMESLECLQSGDRYTDMVETKFGCYVLYDDYKEDLGNLQADFNNLQRSYDRLVERIGDLYKEF